MAAINGHDIQICISKALKLLTRTCVAFSLKHPYITLSTLCSTLVYFAFPPIFWALLYSFPLAVCSAIFLVTSSNAGKSQPSGDRIAPRTTCEQTDPYGPTQEDSSDSKVRRKPVSRVHSVRQRRAKEIETHKSEEDKNAEFDYETVDKNALTEEEISLKDIREVEVVNSNSIKAIMQGNEPEEDQQMTKMDVVISDGERTKRLESLIARRRSRKLRNLEVRRTLVSKDRGEHHHVSSIIIPKNGAGGRFLAAPGGNNPPSPGSAPSVLIPMRNPFDLPYDPQEEKPNLTGDGFEQEFMTGGNGRDAVFCRHESFSLGGFLSGEMGAREVSSPLPDSRFVQRTFSALGCCRQFTRPAEREFTPILEHEPFEPPESGTTFHTPHGDHIKEVIQVHEADEKIDETENPTNPNSPSSSSDEDAPTFRIDRDAILKSLSSMARRNSPLNEKTGDHPGGGLRDRCYYSDGTARQHRASYSIASDLQVEVSELSSPPLTIDENLSYPDFDVDSWAGSSLLDLSLVDEYEPGREKLLGSNRALEDPDEMCCGHPWCAITEFPDSCSTTRSMNLEEKLGKTLERSFSQLAQVSSPSKAKKQEEHFHVLKVIEKELSITDMPETTGRETEEERFGNSDEQNGSEDSEEILEADHLEMIMSSPAIMEDQIQLESRQTSEILAEGSADRMGFGTDARELLPNRVAIEFAQSSLASPKSVLHPTCSVSSFDHYQDDEMHRTPTAHQNSTLVTGQSSTLPDFDGRDEVVEVISEPWNTSTTEAAASGSSSIHSICEAQAEMTQETSPSSYNNDDELLSEKLLTSKDQSNEPDSLISTEEELYERKEIAIGDANEGAGSDSHEDQGHKEHHLSKTSDREGEENSTDHPLDDATIDSSIFENSGPVEDNATNKSYEKNEEHKAEQIQTSNESLEVPEDKRDANASLIEESKSKITQPESE